MLKLLKLKLGVQMEFQMNNIIKDVEELKELIKESDEYKDYTKSK